MKKINIADQIENLKKIKNFFTSTQRRMILLLCLLTVIAAGIIVYDIRLSNNYLSFRDTKIYVGSSFPGKDTSDSASIFSYQTGKVRISVHEYDEYPSHFFVADVWVKDTDCFRCAFSNNEYDTNDQTALEIARNSDALIAVNSDFNWGLVIRNGELFSTDAWDTPMLVMYINGRMEINYDQYYTDPDKLLRSGVMNTWTFGPVLVDDGSNVCPEEDESYDPRTALGYYCPGHYCFVVVDGRQRGYSSGIYLSDLADLMVSLGCRIAYNFDGGASSQMVAEGKYINHPSQERLQRNMIVITDR